MNFDDYPKSAQKALDLFQQELGDWAENTFPGQTVAGKLAHLAREVEEVIANPHDIMEYADCFLLLIDAARLRGIKASAIVAHAVDKLEINKRRKWGEPNADGSVEHCKDQGATGD